MSRPEAQGPSDAALVLSARGGDRQACEALYKRHAAMANGLAFKVLGRDSEVDDVVQDAFTTALTALRTLHDGQAFASWLCSIVVRTAQRSIRRRRLWQRFGLLRREGVDLEGVVSRAAPSDITAELRAIYGVLDDLPPDLGTVLVLHRVEGLGLEEIAETTRMSVRTVKRRLAKAQKLFQRRLGAREGNT